MVIVKEKEKSIYNQYLKISRSKKGQPFKYRKTWTDWVDKPEYATVKKIGIFLDKFPHIKIEDYLEAPYQIISNDETFTLDFYSSHDAIKTYTMYMKKLDMESIDSDRNFNFIKDSILYFYSFCNKHNLKSYNDYFNYKEFSVPIFLKHYKERNLSIYFLIYIGMDEYYWKFSEDEREFLFPDINKNLVKFKDSLIHSKKSLKFLEAATKKIIEKFRLEDK